MDYSVLHALLPRYLRRLGMKSGTLSAHAGDSVAQELLFQPGFYCVPGYSKLNGTDEYKRAGCYPMDVSSYMAILALDIPVDRPATILDLCCCPGSKLLCLTEQAQQESIVVGVDSSLQRLRVCRSLLLSWAEPSRTWCISGTARKLVFHADGTAFGCHEPGNLIYDSCIVDEEIAAFGGTKKRNKSYRDRESKRLKVVQERLRSTSTLAEAEAPRVCLDEFDLVLVDAECTHDASYRHMKYINGVPNDSSDLSTAFIKPSAALSHDSAYHGSRTVQTTASAELTELQRGLILNGFRRLRAGGYMVYSTCSRDPTQNEEVVRWLRETVGAEAELVDVGSVIRDACGRGDGPLGTEAQQSEHSGESATSLTPALDFLDKEPAELFAAIHATYPTEELRRDLADALCREMCSLRVPRLHESALLPGCVSVDYRCGMSGHFIAKVRKLQKLDTLA
jgi:16S rRNA C967 or C1407 C5-methylase (RsmB/RsmF family)